MDPFALLFEQMFQSMALDPNMMAGLMAGTGMPPPEPGAAFGGAPLGAYAANTGFGQQPQPQPQAQAQPVDPLAGFAEAQAGMHGTGELPGTPMSGRGVTAGMGGGEKPQPQQTQPATQMTPGAQNAQQQQQVQAQPQQGAQAGPAAPNIQDFSKGKVGRSLDPGKVDRIVFHDVSGNPKTRKLPDPQNVNAYHITFDDKGVYQHLPLNIQAPHAADFNKSSIAIARRGFEGDKMSPAELANSRIARDMALKQYPNIKPENFTPHPALGAKGTRSGGKDPREGSWVAEMMADKNPQAQPQTMTAQAQSQPQPQQQPLIQPQQQAQAQTGPQRPLGEMLLGGPESYQGGPQPDPRRGAGITGGEGLDSIMGRLPKSDITLAPEPTPVPTQAVVASGGNALDRWQFPQFNSPQTAQTGAAPNEALDAMEVAPTPVEVATGTPPPKLGGGTGSPATGDPANPDLKPGQVAQGSGVGQAAKTPYAMNPMMAAAKALTGGSSDQRPIMTGGVAGAQKAPELQKATKGVSSITMDMIMQLLGSRRQNPLISPTLGSLLRG